MSSYVEEKVLVKKIEYYRIKEGVRIICDHAFSECKKLRNIGLPSSINFIGKYAFKGCLSLDKIVLPESLVYIGDGAFYCEDHNKGRTIPFRITIPPSVETFEGNPFCYKTIIDNNNERFKVIDNVLFSADGKVLISYCSPKDEYIIPYGVERIGVGAFRRTPIKNVFFPETLRIIDKQAFDSAIKLEKVVFPNSLKEIRENAFKWCDFKTGSVTFPSNIENISHEAFNFGWDIKIIRVPKGRLDYFKSILPKDVSNQIYDDDLVFENCMYFNSDRTELISAISESRNFIIPEGVIKIRDGAFCGISCIDHIKFPSTIKYITIDAFDYDLPEFKSLFVPKGSRQYYEEIFKDFKDEIEEYEQ